MATATQPRTPVVPIPFPTDASGKSTLKVPLSAAQRAAIISFLVADSAAAAALAGDPKLAYTPAELATEKDQGLIDVYETYVAYLVKGQGQLPSPNIVSTVGDFLGNLSKGSTWTRIAEFTVGALLVAIGVNAALKAATTQSRNPVSQGAKGVTKPISTATKTAGRATFLAARKREANKYVR